MQALTFATKTKKEECTLMYSVLEEEPALWQVRSGGDACACEDVHALQEGFYVYITDAIFLEGTGQRRERIRLQL